MAALQIKEKHCKIVMGSFCKSTGTIKNLMGSSVNQVEALLKI